MSCMTTMASCGWPFRLVFVFEETLRETPALYMVNLKATVSRLRIHDESFFFNPKGFNVGLETGTVTSSAIVD